MSNRNYYKLEFFVTCFLMLLNGVLVAQENDIIRLSQLSLRELLEVEIAVSSLENEPALQAPSSVTVFTREEILDMGVRTVEELLNYVPGFISVRETFINQAYRTGARGSFSPPPSYNILFLIDGQRLNSDLAGGALFDNRFITTANIERIEIIRGPGSALYGTSAFSGVVSIITTRDTNNVYAAIGNLRSREFSANTSFQQDDMQFSGFFRYYQDDGQNYGPDLTSLIDPNIASTRDPYSALDFNGNLSWRDRTHLNVRFSTRDVDDFISFETLQAGFAGNKSYTGYINLKTNLVENQNWGVAAHLGYLRGAVDEREEFTGDLGTFKFESSEIKLRLDGWHHVSGHQLKTGISYRRPDTHDWQFVIRTNNNVIPQGPLDSRDILGIYLQDQYNFTSTLRGTFGLRVDWYSDTGYSVNPRAALAYFPQPSTSFKVLYGEAFRAPNRFQSGDFLLGNPEIISEKIRTLEVAWLQDYENLIAGQVSLQSTVTWFFSQHKNKIQLEPGPGVFGLNTANSNKNIQTSGFEIELSAGFGEYTSVRTAYTYLPKTESNPQKFSTHSFSIITNYRRDRWNLNVNAIYQSETEQLNRQDLIDPINTLKDFWRVNTSARYEMLEQLWISFRVYNLFDKKYFSPTEVPALINGLENRGREYNIGLEYLW